jgi:hypothetical protein
LNSNAQYLIRFKVDDPVDSIVFLRGMLFDSKKFISKDTIHLTKGLVVSKSNTSIIGGIYYLFFPKSGLKVHFILEKRDTMDISFSGKDPLSTIKSSKHGNNVYFDYQRLEFSMSHFDSSLLIETANGKKFNLAQRDVFFKKKRDSLMAFRKNAIGSLQENSFLALHFKTLNTLDDYLPQRSRPDLRESFINEFNLNEPRLLFSDDLEKIYYEYLSAFPLNADSLSKGIDTVMYRLLCNNKAFSYSFDYFVGVIKNRSVVNSTKGLVSIINNHVRNGKCPFPDTIRKREYLKLYETNNQLNSNNLSVDMLLKDSSGIEISLHNYAAKNDFTIIMFYDPNCIHCQVEIPAMDSTINMLEKKYGTNIGRYAICNDADINEGTWKKFIADYKLTNNYVHVRIDQNSIYRKDYDAYSNPVFYLIDNTGLFVLRKISPTSLSKAFQSIVLQNKNDKR